MNGFNDFDQTDREYSLAAMDHLVRLWSSKVTPGRRNEILQNSTSHELLQKSR